jgi:Holliday junction resolvase RusA-like endonuclease
MGLTRKQCQMLGIGHLYPGRLTGKGKRRSEPARGKSFGILPEQKEGGPTSWTIIIPGWTPPSLNTLIYSHWAVSRKAKKKAMEQVAGCCLEAGVTRAIGRRRVAIIVFAGRRSHRLDGDNVPKSILDGMKHIGAIIDDNCDWCELVPAQVCVSKQKRTVILLDEIGGTP